MVKKYERQTVNHHVAGSIPARGAIFTSFPLQIRCSDSLLLKFFSYDAEKILVLLVVV